MSHPIPRVVTATALTIAAAMLAVPVAAQDGSAELESGVLGEILPAEVAGLPLDALEFPFQFLLEDADPDDPDDAAGIEAFEAFADSQGAAIEDFILGNASAIDYDTSTGVLVTGVRTSDLETAPDLEAFVELMLALDPSLSPGGSDMAVESSQIDGRDVLLVTLEVLQDGEFNESDHVGVSVGGYALLLQGDPDPILEIVAALPSGSEEPEEDVAEPEADSEAPEEAPEEEPTESEDG